MFGIVLGIRYSFSKIGPSLKLLQIEPPTTKKAIKLKYKQLAKLLHPDMTSDEGKAKSEAQIKTESNKFIEITNAYKYLGNLSEEEINSKEERVKESDNFDAAKSSYRGMGEQQRKRHATNSYFNRRYQRFNEGDDVQKKPLWKVMPQFFFGIFLVCLFMMEWANAAYFRSKNNISQGPPRQTRDHVYRNMSFKRRAQKPEPLPMEEEEFC